MPWKLCIGFELFESIFLRAFVFSNMQINNFAVLCDAYKFLNVLAACFLQALKELELHL